jgi:hypothetical protein
MLMRARSNWDCVTESANVDVLRFLGHRSKVSSAGTPAQSIDDRRCTVHTGNSVYGYERSRYEMNIMIQV